MQIDMYADIIVGLQYGNENKNNKEAIFKINDFAWLEETYKNAN